ncbi:hypothetical protein [Rhodococcus sp. C3V]|uniref:hypothetical protein n=1 Tax=Rhodococcus sp. C3V TaxID=3034165 RepID=UPI0023E2AC7E|nr:hypothetical protein [Rhodococcus sp. C3V]MDF3319686.1 hypothetical protein [Rhodococcus sp. C3V]
MALAHHGRDHHSQLAYTEILCGELKTVARFFDLRQRPLRSPWLVVKQVLADS